MNLFLCAISAENARCAPCDRLHAIGARPDMDATFSVEAWSAYAAGLDDQTAWCEWARAPWLPSGDAMPALAEMAPMQRRRVERLGRAALQVAWRCQHQDDGDLPLVFASRHGDLDRTHRMLAELARDEPLSPTQFGLSTHNAIAAQFSIARGDSTAYTTIAAGDATVEAAFVEALGQLADGVPSATIVYYDEPLPDPYCHFSRPAEFARAWACRLTLDDAGEFSVLPVDVDASDAACEDADQDAIPGDLAVLRFLRSGREHLQRGVGNTCWRWQRHARPD